LALALLGCKANHVHIFGAYRYDTAQDCLEGPVAVDVIDGPDPGTCPRLRCWVSPGEEVYVTATACDAPVDYEERTRDPSAACVKALDAYGRADHGRCAGGVDDDG
jgi:hypothetical protein